MRRSFFDAPFLQDDHYQSGKSEIVDRDLIQGTERSFKSLTRVKKNPLDYEQSRQAQRVCVGLHRLE
jgi:hypothetical protein